MSRLDAVADALGLSVDEARRYTRAVRAQFQAAPSYAQILRAIRGLGGRPSPQQVAARIKAFQEGEPGARPSRGRRPASPRRRSSGRGSRRR
ncbi:MAG TPA: hypothetical protein GX714_07680 [Chloroflexi bacterium]|nr:hypothetical protein [Chloroflexota bacterium]